MTEETGFGNLPPIPENDKNPDAPIVKDAPLETNTAGPSLGPILHALMQGKKSPV